MALPFFFQRGWAFRAAACLAIVLAPAAPATAQGSDARNFEGTWMLAGGDLFLGIDFPYTPEGQNLTADRLRLVKEGHSMASPHLTCRPTGMAGVIASKTPLLILQPGPQIIVITQEDREVRIIDMDRPHPRDLKPTYSGDAVALWEGDTLVVDTIGYNGKGQIDEVANPQSAKAHLVERWTKSEDGARFTIEFTVDDPVYYTRPFTVTREFKRVTGARIGDYDCAENPRSDDYENMTFADETLRPTCLRPVVAGVAADRIICTPVADSK